MVARTTPQVPTRAEAFRYWLRVGCRSFGDPAGLIALMHRELVLAFGWRSTLAQIGWLFTKAMVPTIAAVVALFRAQVGVMPVVVACGSARLLVGAMR